MTSSGVDFSHILTRSSDSLYRQIVDHWKGKIVAGELKVGDMLPSERELAQQFQVSRIPVREALKVLEYLGIVEHVRGKGVYVRQLVPSQLLAALGPLLVASPDLLLELFELRLLFEPRAAYLAAGNRAEDDLANLSALIRENESHIAYGLPTRDDSFVFHCAVMAASHNAVFLMLNSFLMELQRQSRRETLQSKDRMLEALSYHKEIFDRISARDADGAADAMRRHLTNARAVLYATRQQES